VKECPTCGLALLDSDVECPECGGRWLEGGFRPAPRPLERRAPAAPAVGGREGRDPRDYTDVVPGPLDVAVGGCLPTPLLIALVAVPLTVSLVIASARLCARLVRRARVRRS